MNNAPLPLAITLMDFDKFMLSVTDTGTALFSPLSAYYEDRHGSDSGHRFTLFYYFFT